MREATKLIKAFKKARDEIKAKLLFTPDNTFTEAKLKNALVQIEAGLRDLKIRTSGSTQQTFSWFTEQGIEDGVREVSEFEKRFTGVRAQLPIDQIINSTDPETLLFNNYQSSIDNYSANLRNKFQSALTQSLLQGQSWGQAVAGLDGVGGLVEWELARIVRTELHGIYGMSKVNGFGTIKQDYLPDLKKTLYHPMDSRTGDDSIAMSKKNMIVDIDDPFIFTFKNKTYAFMSPPNRPNDRAIVIPYREAWNV